MPSKSNKTNQASKEIIDVSKLNINDKLTGGAKKNNKEPEPDSESEPESSESESSDNSIIDEQVSSDDDRDIDEEEEQDEEQEETEETETEETDKETDADEKTNKESDNESKEEDDEDIEENTKDKCYQKFSKKSNVDTDIDYDEYFIKDDEIIINKTGRLTKPYLTKYEKVRILGDRARQLAQGAKPMIKNTTGLSHKEVALLELKSKVIPLIIERPIPNVGVEKWKLSELEINL
jgi:DNA-directed RNA polymerase I, II, and III subunit RPABC2